MTNSAQPETPFITTGVTPRTLPWTQGNLRKRRSMLKGCSKFHSLLHISSVLDQGLDILLTPTVIRLKQTRIFNMPNRIKPSLRKVLTKQFYVTFGSNCAMIDRLLVAGLVHREQHHDDKRTDMVSLFERGKDVILAVRNIWLENDDRMLEKLGAEKAALFFELTREFKNALGELSAARITRSDRRART